MRSLPNRLIVARALLTAMVVAALIPTATPAAAGRALLRVDAAGDEDLAERITGALTDAMASEANLEIVLDTHNSALRHSADLELLCRVRRSGFRIEAIVADAGDQGLIARQVVTGSEEEIFDLVDQLGIRLVDDVAARDGAYQTIAVLDFRGEAGADGAPLTSGLPDMLMTIIRQRSELTLIEPGQVELRAATPTTDLSVGAAADLSRWLGADLVLTGTLSDILDVQLEAVGARGVTRRARRVGPRGDLALLATELARNVSAHLASDLAANRTVAVLPFANRGEARFDALVRGLPDMLTTTLGQGDKLTVIERVQIDQALRNFNLEMSGPIDSETAVEVGAWLGADAVVLGSFLRFGKVFRLDARMIDAATGEVIIAQSVRGKEEEVLAMVDSLGGELQRRFDEEQGGQGAGTGTLQVVFRAVKSEMGERPTYHHICKLYVDGDYMGLSPVVAETDRWTLLFDKNIRAGTRRVEIVHGYVQDGQWDGRMPEQPERFNPVVEPGGRTTIRYTYNVGWFEDQYVYEP
jgi:TolB-like protein